MERGLTAVAFLALLLCASADRSLLAHKPGAGGLHMVALAETLSSFPPVAGTQAAQFLYLTNGNGTWYNVSNVGFTQASLNNGSSSVTGQLFQYPGMMGLAFPSRSLGVMVGVSAPGNPVPNIITSADGALTWQAVTGFVGNPPAGFSRAGNVAPDLQDIHCMTRALCVAVGGYLASPSAIFPTLGVALALAAPGLLDSFGAVYTSTNGGSSWSSVALPQPVGGLYSVRADTSGKHVYAVGFTPLASNLTAGSALASPPVPYSQFSGSIIYSGDYARTWISQLAPVISGYTYTLYTVYVLRGTMAFAGGGSPYGYYNSLLPANGIIIGTANGGFTWVAQPISMNSGSGYAMANGTIPRISCISFNTANGQYVGWATASQGNQNTAVLKTTLPIKSRHGMDAAYFSTTWTQTLLPALTGTKSQVLTGIVWDSNLVGYIYGTLTLLATHDGGITWFSELPPAAAIQNDAFLQIASVPTTY